PFTVYARTSPHEMSVSNYAVSAGDTLEDSWALGSFAGAKYHLQVYGPNGFFREFIGTADASSLAIRAEYSNGSSSGRNVQLKITNQDAQQNFDVLVTDQSYKADEQKHTLEPGGTVTVTVDTQRSHCWYDFIVRVAQLENFQRRFAGRVE